LKIHYLSELERDFPTLSFEKLKEKKKLEEVKSLIKSLLLRRCEQRKHFLSE
jgi:hypothetical protein